MKVKDVMTKNPHTIAPEHTFEDAWRYINKLKIWTLPVVKDDEIVGVVTKSDLKYRSKNNKQKISAVMSKTLFLVSPEDEAKDVFFRLKRAKVNAFMVVKNNKLEGIITQFDLKKLSKKVEKYKCPYCDALYDHCDNKCPNCGAPMK